MKSTGPIIHEPLPAMSLEKAIEILTTTPIGVLCGDDLKYGKARQLGIEAMKRIQKGRSVDHAFACVRLPGETEA